MVHIGDSGYTLLDRECSRVFPSAIRDVVTSLEPRTTGNLKVALIVRGAPHTTT